MTQFWNEPIFEDLPARFFFAGESSRQSLAKPFIDLAKPWPNSLAPSTVSRVEFFTQPEPGNLYLYDRSGEGFYKNCKNWSKEACFNEVDCYNSLKGSLAVGVWPIQTYELVYVFTRCCSPEPMGPMDLTRHLWKVHYSKTNLPSYSRFYQAPNLTDVPFVMDVLKIRSLLGINPPTRKAERPYIPVPGDVYVLDGRVEEPLDGGSPVVKILYYFPKFTIIHYYDDSTTIDKYAYLVMALCRDN